ncbi:MAG TPA: hypothetical protein VIU29_03895 [Candidatus Deferrimicrobiaceae bacterium]
MTRRTALFLPTLFALFTLAACGPVLGLLSKTTEGTDVRTVDGDPAAIRAGSRLAILSPFPKTKEGFYILKGEDERRFAEEFNRLGYFKAEAGSGSIPVDSDGAKALASKSPSGIKAELGLAAEPDVLLTGTLLSRKTYVAPMRGVVMAVSWRLVFTDLRSGRSWTVDARSKELAEETIPRIVGRIGDRIGR